MVRDWVVVTLFIFANTIAVKSQNFKVIPLNDTVDLKLEERPFIWSDSDIVYNADSIICLINDYPAFGTDGLLPSSTLSLAEVTISGRTISLSTKGMYDPCIALKDSTSGTFFLANNSEYIVRFLFSIGAGVYGVEDI